LKVVLDSVCQIPVILDVGAPRGIYVSMANSRYLKRLEGALGEFNDWEYVGGSKSEGRFARRFVDGRPPPPWERHCVCGHEIAEQCWIYRATTGDLRTVGNCCMKRFLPPGEARKQHCRDCGGGHNNRVAGLCNACGKCPHGAWLPEKVPGRPECEFCPKPCESCGQSCERYLLNARNECQACAWVKGKTKKGLPKWTFRDLCYGYTDTGALWTKKEGEFRVWGRHALKNPTHGRIRRWLEKGGPAGLRRDYSDDNLFFPVDLRTQANTEP